MWLIKCIGFIGACILFFCLEPKVRVIIMLNAIFVPNCINILESFAIKEIRVALCRYAILFAGRHELLQG